MPTTSTPVPRSVLREANRIVEAEPAIEAIVLFGSRARGEHHRGSDIDLAVVSTAPRDKVWDACCSLTEASDAVQIVPVDPGRPSDVPQHREPRRARRRRRRHSPCRHLAPATTPT